MINSIDYLWTWSGFEAPGKLATSNQLLSVNLISILLGDSDFIYNYFYFLPVSLLRSHVVMFWAQDSPMKNRLQISSWTAHCWWQTTKERENWNEGEVKNLNSSSWREEESGMAEGKKVGEGKPMLVNLPDVTVNLRFALFYWEHVLVHWLNWAMFS